VWGGPLLIAGSVLLVLHDVAFGGMISNQHPDVLAFWYPSWCLLGKSLAAGHVLAWNPHVMAGVPFAADPQSGWMYLPPMLLFSALPCSVAMGWMIVLQPMLGGLALYAFLRAEGLSRPAATVGGLALALGLSASRLVLFLPFPSALAWTAVVLAAAARLVRSTTRRGRVLWVLATAVAWGQLAAAHLGHGLILGTGLLLAYLMMAAWRSVRAGRWTLPGVARGALGLAGAMAVVNLAFLLPRLAYAPRSSYSAGYANLIQLGILLRPAWPLTFSTFPGAHLGAVALGLSFAAFWSRRHRALTIAFAAYGLVAYVAGIAAVGSRLARILHAVPLLNFYDHYPARFSVGLILVIPVMAAIGLEAWNERPAVADRALMAAPGLLVWFVGPALLGAGFVHLSLLLGAGVLTAGLLVACSRRPSLIVLAPVLVAVELVTGGLLGQAGGALGSDLAMHGDPFGAKATGWWVPLRRPNVEAGAYDDPGPIARTLQAEDGARYLSIAPGLVSHRGYLDRQLPGDWGLLANQRAMLFGLEDAGGYNPFQLEWYWRFVRAQEPGAIDYNAAFFVDPTPRVMDLLQVGWVIAPAGEPPWSNLSQVVTEGRWALYRLPLVAPRASVLEAGGEATYTSHGPQAATVVVRAPGPAVVLVRNAFDPGWHATVDGHPVDVLRTDSFLQGISVSAGTHTIELTYDDPWVGYGLLGSALGVLALLGAALVVGRSDRGDGRDLPGLG
jgi:hypothetical protein